MMKPFDWRAVLAVHPAAELLPQITETELRDLATDIKEHGLRVPLVAWSPADGRAGPVLLDGRNGLDALAPRRLVGAAPLAITAAEKEGARRGRRTAGKPIRSGGHGQKDQDGDQKDRDDDQKDRDDDCALTPKEAASFLRVSTSWLAKSRGERKGPHYSKLGRSIRYLKSELIRYMKSNQK